MDELINRLNKVLANATMLYLKASFFHWNVTGSNFPQYHSFFGDFYNEIYGSVDTIAEYIRTLDGIPHSAPSMVKANSSISEVSEVGSAENMMRGLLEDVYTSNKDIMSAIDMADKFKKVGISNFLQERQAAFDKHAWMLKSILKA